MAGPRVVGIVQARMSSSRLPGKVLMEVAGKPILEHILDRARRSIALDAVVLATSEDAGDEPLERLGRRLGVPVFRGSLDDVLDRFYRAALAVEANVVVRVGGDSPFVDPRLVDAAVRAHLGGDADFTGADMGQYPAGTGYQVVSFAALERAWREGDRPEDREHVTYYLLRNRDHFRVQFIPAAHPWPREGVRLAVDEPDDLTVTRAIYARLYREGECFGLDDVFRLWQGEPELFRGNAHVREKPTSQVSTAAWSGAPSAA